MLSKLRVVPARMVFAEVCAAAFSTSQPGMQDGAGYCEQGLGFEEDAAAPVLLRETMNGGFDGVALADALAQGQVMAEQAGGSPHHALQLLDEFAKQRFIARVNRLHRLAPRYRWSYGSQGGRNAGGVLQHRLCSAGAENEAFEQRVRGQAVGAVNARAGGFASGVKTGKRSAPAEIMR